MIIDLQDYLQVDAEYLRRQAKTIETKTLKKYHKSPDWIAILDRLKKSIVTTCVGGYIIDHEKLKAIKREIEAGVANEISAK